MRKHIKTVDGEALAPTAIWKSVIIWNIYPFSLNYQKRLNSDLIYVKRTYRMFAKSEIGASQHIIYLGGHYHGYDEGIQGVCD